MYRTDGSAGRREGRETVHRSTTPEVRHLLSLPKRERKSNYSVDSYFKDTLLAGSSKIETGPKLPRAPKQIAMQVVLFFSIDTTYTMLHHNMKELRLTISEQDKGEGEGERE